MNDLATSDSDDLARNGAPASLNVADKVREAILSGDLPPDERVNEVHLSRRLGVSRTPTRAALHALAAEGLLDYERNRGFTVRAYSTAEISDAYEIRAVLEGLACRFAAERGIESPERDLMEKALVQGDVIVAGFQENPSRIDEYREVNVSFHDAIIASSRNRMLADIIKLTFARPGATHRNIVSFTHPEVRRRHDDHHRIFEALISGDAWRAELLMREHVTSVKSSRLQTLPGPFCVEAPRSWI